MIASSEALTRIHAITENLLDAPAACAFPEFPPSWYLFAPSSKVTGHPFGKRMLGKNLVAYRKTDGQVVVMNARCAHLGADLSNGDVHNDCISCPYHNWRYDAHGNCVNIPGSHSIPKYARQQVYTAEERHGFIFIFNGGTPSFPLPFHPGEDPMEYAEGMFFEFIADCTWYMFTSHGYDLQHFSAVHDRRLLKPPLIDCPAPHARRNRYHAEVLGKTPLDKLLKCVAGGTVQAEITTWAGTFVTIAADFPRARSRFLISAVPTEDGRTLAQGVVLMKRSPLPWIGYWHERLALSLRKFFTHGYLQDEADQLGRTDYRPGSLIEGDREMVEYFRWLAAIQNEKHSSSMMHCATSRI